MEHLPESSNTSSSNALHENLSSPQTNKNDKITELSTTQKVIGVTIRGIKNALLFAPSLGQKLYANIFTSNTQKNVDLSTLEINKANKKGTEILETKITHTPESFADEVLKNLEKDQGITDNKGSLCWKGSNGQPINTGQKTEKLRNALITQFKIAEKTGSMIQVRLKYGHEEGKVGFKHRENGGETRFATIDLQGKIKEVSKKTGVLGAGMFGKAMKIENTEGEKAIKTTYIKSEDKPEKQEELSDKTKILLDNSEKDILNENKKLIAIHAGKLIPGVQRPPEHSFILIRGEGKSLETKIGYQGSLYSGDADPFDHKGQLKDEDWTSNWTPLELLKGARDLTEGLHICHHEKGVYFGDIKTANIFRDDKTKELLLGDLGGSQNKEEIWDKEKNQPIGHVGTPATTCMEDFEKISEIDNGEDYAKFREKMDVYSLGVSLYEMLTKNKSYELPTGPFASTYIADHIDDKINNNPMSEKLASLILKMTRTDISQRITSQQAYEEMTKIYDKFKPKPKTFWSMFS